MNKYILFLIKNLLTIFYGKIIFFLGLKQKKHIIPKGMYCYSPDFKKNENSNDLIYYVIRCPYYKFLWKHWNGCSYLGIITDDFAFDDQCKICGENID